MKFRCKNCYKVLKPNEEYCTHCGEHSDEVASYMTEEKHSLDAASKFKLSLIIFLAVAFVGTGILMVSFALIQNKRFNIYDTNTCKAISFLITSIVLFIFTIILSFKELDTLIFNGTIKQLQASCLIMLVVCGIIIVLNYLSTSTRAIPNYMIDFKNDNIIFSVDGNWMSIPTLLISLILSIISEEVLVRKRVIDMLDEETLLGDASTIIISSIIGTLLNFSWLMSTEIIISVFIMNLACSAIYIYTNRSLVINILFRIIMICLIFIL